MIAVAILAINFGMIRACWGVYLLNLGVIPMANVLGLTYLALRKRPAERPFLVGFEVFGLVALSLFIRVSSQNERELIFYYLQPLLSPIESLAPRSAFMLVGVIFPLAIALLGLPQLLFAFFGGYLSRRYRIIRRTAAGSTI
ncbi:hypothetical protein ACYOEI_11065 [Singulisphaera rosea]